MIIFIICQGCWEIVKLNPQQVDRTQFVRQPSVISIDDQ